MKEVYLYKKLGENNVQCKNCGHYCVISPGKRGICRTRENKDGILYALNYGKIIALNVDPIEKKPFFHFLPGSSTLSIASVGCNLRCFNCQNYDISQGFKDEKEIPGKDMSPKEIVEMAIKNKCPSISYTYTEPTIFLEFALDTMKIAKKKGLKNIWVSNGFMSKEAVSLILPYLDANNIDIKGYSDAFYAANCGASVRPILETARTMKKAGVWMEITTLAIPTLNTDEETFRRIAEFIYKELGPETPWHISQFCSAISWKLKKLYDTPVETLEMAYKIGKETGLKYVYTGNVPGLPTEDTFCPDCGTLAIDRTGYLVSRHDKKGRCPKCKKGLNIILK
jgi:pyruvate formate lyase activating enzyme